MCEKYITRKTIAFATRSTCSDLWELKLNASNKPDADRPLKWIWFLSSLFLVSGFGVVLMIDALHMLHCKKMISPERLSQITLLQGKVFKEKKNRRGNLVWQIEFIRPDGTVVHGKREAFEHIQGRRKAGDAVSIVDIPEAPACWDVSTSEQKPMVYRARQTFAISISGGFGIFFLLCGALLTFWSSRRLFFDNLKKPL